MFDTPFDRTDNSPAAGRQDEASLADDIAARDDTPSVANADQDPRRRRWLFGLGLVLVAAAAFWWLRGGSPAPAAMPVPVVTVATPLAK